MGRDVTNQKTIRLHKLKTKDHESYLTTKDNVIIQAAPIIQWMRGKTLRWVEEYADTNNYEFTTIDIDRR